MIVICFHHEPKIFEALLGWPNNEWKKFENHSLGGLGNMIEEYGWFARVYIHSSSGRKKFWNLVEAFSFLDHGVAKKKDVVDEQNMGDVQLVDNVDTFKSPRLDLMMNMFA